MNKKTKKNSVKVIEYNAQIEQLKKENFYREIRNNLWSRLSSLNTDSESDFFKVYYDMIKKALNPCRSFYFKITDGNHAVNVSELSFYRKAVKNKLFNFKEFFDFYLKKHETQLRMLSRGYDFELFKIGLRARLYRTQIGLLTEYHAYLLAIKIFGEPNVKRNAYLDNLGVDFQIILNKIVYNIHIFVDTPRAWKFRNYKAKYKQVDSLKGTHVDFPYSLEQNKINSLRFLRNHFGVYTESYFMHLKHNLLNGVHRAKNINDK